MGKRYRKQKKVSKKEEKDQDAGTLASPVCYARADELRPEFREDGDERQAQISKVSKESKKS